MSTFPFVILFHESLSMYELCKKNFTNALLFLLINRKIFNFPTISRETYTAKRITSKLKFFEILVSVSCHETRMSVYFREIVSFKIYTFL